MSSGVLNDEQKQEIQRRATLGRSEVDTPSGFQRVNGVGNDPPFRSDEQQWVLFSVSHTGMAPRSLCADRPAIRVYGCFPDRDMAISYVEMLRESDPHCSLMLNRTHTWILACRDAERLADAAYVDLKTTRLLDAHAAALTLGRREFLDSVRKMQEDDRPALVVDGNVPSDDEDEMDVCAKSAPKPGTEPPGGTTTRARGFLPASCELSGQRVACVCFVQDPGEDAPEVLFNVLGCFGSDAEADRYVRNVASVQVVDHDIDVVQTLRWIYPTIPVETTVKREYRSSELTAIMHDHTQQPAKVAQLQREMDAGSIC